MRAYRSAVPLRLVVDAGSRRFEPKLKSDEEGEWWGYEKISEPDRGISIVRIGGAISSDSE